MVACGIQARRDAFWTPDGKHFIVEGQLAGKDDTKDWWVAAIEGGAPVGSGAFGQLTKQGHQEAVRQGLILHDWSGASLSARTGDAPGRPLPGEGTERSSDLPARSRRTSPVSPNGRLVLESAGGNNAALVVVSPKMLAPPPNNWRASSCYPPSKPFRATNLT